MEQAGPGPSHRHIQGSKIAKKDFQVSSILFYSTRKSKIFEKKLRKNYILKKWTEWCAGARASASPWRAKVSQCRKIERGDPFRFFNIHSVAKHEKNEENKNLTMPKKLKGGTLWDFSTSILSQNIKKMQWGPFGENFFFKKKSRSVEKK